MFRSQGREEETAMKTGKLVAGELRVKPEECGVVKAKYKTCLKEAGTRHSKCCCLLWTEDTSNQLKALRKTDIS